jgi:hypothetical protein
MCYIIDWKLLYLSNVRKIKEDNMNKLPAVIAVVIVFAVMTASGCAGNTTHTASPPAAETSAPIQTAEPPPDDSPSSEVPSPSDIIRSANGISVQDRSIMSFDFLGDMKDVKEISFQRCTFADGLVLPYIESLETMGFNGCNPEAAEIVKNNAQITQLNLGAGMTELSILEDLPNLTILSLTANNIKDLGPVSACLNLETLYLNDGNYELTTLKPLFGLKNLTHISMNLKTYFNIAREDLEHYGADPDFSSAPDPDAIIEVD